MLNIAEHLYLVMVKGIRNGRFILSTGTDCSKFCESSRVWQKIPEEGERVHRPKRVYNNSVDNSSPNTQNNINYEALSLKKKKHLNRLYCVRKLLLSVFNIIISFYLIIKLIILRPLMFTLTKQHILTYCKNQPTEISTKYRDDKFFRE